MDVAWEVNETVTQPTAERQIVPPEEINHEEEAARDPVDILIGKLAFM